MSSGIATRTASILAGEQAQLADSYNRIVQAQAKAACCHSPVAVQITSRGDGRSCAHWQMELRLEGDSSPPSK
ncbi:hypothetical protein ACOSP7_026771 [Xanthoceras sorbifolium]